MNNIYEKYPYFGQLVRINNYFLDDKSIYNIRLSSSDDLKYFDKLLENFYNILKSTSNIDTILLYLLEMTGKLLYFQPFYDGNSHTLKSFIFIVLTKIGYEISFDSDDFIIPMLSEDEECMLSDVLKFKKLTKLCVKNS